MSEIESIFASLIEKAETRECHWAAKLEGITSGPCPKCRTDGNAIRYQESIDNCTARHELAPLFELCEGCRMRDAFREKMDRWGVPTKVLDASFDNYEIYDDRQRKVLLRARDFVMNKKVFAFFSGTSGTGKGHLTSAIIREMNPRRAYWTTHSGLFTKLWSKDLAGQERMLDHLSRVDLLVLDEMGTKAPSPETREKLYYLINERADKSRKTIMIGNIPFKRRESENKKVTDLGLIDYFPRMPFHDRYLEVGENFTCRWESNRNRRKL